jgi:ubiquinone biosynthesis accessory factor UbiK
MVHDLALYARLRCSAVVYARPMIDRRLFEDLGARINEALRDSPAQDIERNLRALLAAWFDKLDLVLREDFEVQKKLLERAQAKLVDLEARIAELEARNAQPPRI